MSHLWVSGFFAGLCSAMVIEAYFTPADLRRWEWWALVVTTGGWAVFRYLTPYG